MSQLTEMVTICKLLQVSVPPEGVQSISSRLELLEAGYTDNRRWVKAKREFGGALAAFEPIYGEEAVRCCFLHFFLDAINHGQVVAESVARRHPHTRTRICRTPQDVARLMLLLVVQEDLPKYIGIAEELAFQLERREGEVAALVGSLQFARLATPRAR